MKKILMLSLIGMLLISSSVFAHEGAIEGTKEHDEIHYTFEEFYLPIIVIASIIGMIVFNLKNPVGERIEES